MQDYSNSIANALKLLQSYTKLLIYLHNSSLFDISNRMYARKISLVSVEIGLVCDDEINVNNNVVFVQSNKHKCQEVVHINRCWWSL